MTQLAIIGHKTRGKEVIEILEMLGYINLHNYVANCDSLCFYGGKSTNGIYYDWVNDCFADENVTVFALEEFLEKYPYKLNELVLCDDGLLGVITKMEWDCEKSDMKYHISFNTSVYNKWYNSKNIKCKFMAEKDMTNIAITGHSERGKEVIEILEMMGGINKWEYVGDRDCVYYINEHHTINYTSILKGKDFKIFTLEEFLEKYPYKVGDRVRIPEYESEVCINKMLWNGNEVLYEVVVDDEVEQYSAEELNEFNEPNKEETITIDDFKANTKEWLIDKLHDMVISKAIKTIGDIHEELHKPQYPKTYDECVNMFNCSVETVNLTTIAALRELIYCRNAYWKIAGEQMGLGKPWEPDWSDYGNIKYIIGGYDNEIGYDQNHYIHKILAFPTKEMRDMFYENFKELIEMCKDFL